LLLRPGHARRRLEGGAGEIRRAARGRHDPQRSEPGHAVDDQRAARRPPSHHRSRRRAGARAPGRRRPARRRLRGRERPLPVQDRLRRTAPDAAAATARYGCKTVYGGLTWTPQLRAPLTEPGVNVKAGEYLLAVNGRDVRPAENLCSFSENASGRITELTVGPNADGSGSRTVRVVPVASEAAMRNRAWVEDN